MGEVDRCFQCFCDTFMRCKLSAIIRRNRIDANRKRLHQVNHSICHGLSGLALNFLQESQARCPLRERNDGLAMPFANNRIHFPITQPLTGVDDGWSFVNAHPVLELAAPVVAPIALPASLSAA